MRWILFISFLLLFSSVSLTSSQDEMIQINSSDITIDLSINSTSQFSSKTNITIISENNVSSFTIEYKLDLSNVKTEINGTTVPNFVTNENGQTTISITPITSLSPSATIIVELTAELMEPVHKVGENNFQFLYDWKNSPVADVTNVSIILPLGAYISTSQSSLDIFPSPYSIGSDGKRISVHWTNIPGTSQNSQLFIQFSLQSAYSNGNEVVTTENTTNSNIGWIIFLLVTTVLSISISIYLYYQTTSQPSDEEKETRVVKVVKPVILKPHELDVLQTIADHGGGINQSDLVSILDVSKSRVSQYLSEFEQKGLIKKVKMGRENVIQLNVDEESLT